jgi:hypothetical protein
VREMQFTRQPGIQIPPLPEFANGSRPNSIALTSLSARTVISKTSSISARARRDDPRATAVGVVGLMIAHWRVDPRPSRYPMYANTPIWGRPVERALTGTAKLGPQMSNAAALTRARQP